jgi:hypothetical protein
MNKSIAMIIAVMGMTAAGTSAMATEPSYISWTFDDFNSNCEVIETAEVQPVEPSTVAVDIADDVEAGELGW